MVFPLSTGVFLFVLMKSGYVIAIAMPSCRSLIKFFEINRLEKCQRENPE